MLKKCKKIKIEKPKIKKYVKMSSLVIYVQVCMPALGGVHPLKMKIMIDKKFSYSLAARAWGVGCGGLGGRRGGMGYFLGGNFPGNGSNILKINP